MCFPLILLGSKEREKAIGLIARATNVTVDS